MPTETSMPRPPDEDRLDDFSHGLARRREVLGDAWVRRSTLDATDFNADFQDFITRYAWDAVWNRPGLPTETRRLLVLAITMALGRWEEFDLHCRAALAAGVAPETVREVLMQGAIYAGVPAANTAFKRTAALLAELGLKPGPAPLVSAVRKRRHTTFSTPQLAVVLQGEGDKAPVLLAHPLGLSEVVWQDLARRLAEAGHPTLRYDLRGHGRSPNPAGGWGLAELAEDAARLIGEWGRGPVVMLGLSLGGLVAQQVAATRPELLRGLVLARCDSHRSVAERASLDARIDAVRGGGMAAVVDAALDCHLSAELRAARPDIEAALRDILLAQDLSAYALGCAALRDADLRTALARWAGPIRVMAASQPGPVEQPDAFAAEVLAFLSQG